MDRKTFIELEDSHAQKCAQEKGVPNDWHSFSTIRDKKGKLVIQSYCAEGPFVFVDCRSNKVVSCNIYYIDDNHFRVQKLSDRAIAHEAWRMFCWGIPLDLIKRQWQGSDRVPIQPGLLSMATRYQLTLKHAKRDKLVSSDS